MDYQVTSGSSTSVVFLLFLLLVGVFVVLIPVLIGTYVYKDAKSRKMDAVLWTLVAVLVPSFIGLIIYLVIRTNNTNLCCPSCKNSIASEYALCPYCGVSLKASCPSCAAPVDKGWKLCPRCATGLPKQTETVFMSVSAKKDKKLLWILIAAIIIPVLLLVIGIGGMFAIRSTSINISQTTGFGIELDNDTVPVQILNWVSECDANGEGVYVLQLSPEQAREIQYYDYDGRNYTPEDMYSIYVYINTYKGTNSTKLMGSASFGNKTAEVYYDTVPNIAGGKWPDYELSEIRASGYKINKLKILIDDKEVEYSLSEL